MQVMCFMMVEHQNATYLHTHIVRLIHTGVCFHTSRRILEVL